MTQRTIARATVRNAMIVAVGPWLSVYETEIRVKHSIQTLRIHKERRLRLGQKVDVQIRHLLLDEGTAQEREVWDAYVKGGAR